MQGEVIVSGLEEFIQFRRKFRKGINITEGMREYFNDDNKYDKLEPTESNIFSRWQELNRSLDEKQALSILNIDIDPYIQSQDLNSDLKERLLRYGSDYAITREGRGPQMRGYRFDEEEGTTAAFAALGGLSGIIGGFALFPDEPIKSVATASACLLGGIFISPIFFNRMMKKRNIELYKKEGHICPLFRQTPQGLKLQRKELVDALNTYKSKNY